jgi:hypothetical protein
MYVSCIATAVSLHQTASNRMLLPQMMWYSPGTDEFTVLFVGVVKS